MGISSVHLNNNLMCAVDVEATGLLPGQHEIVQLAVIPLSPDLTPSKHFQMFELRIKPENRAVIDPEMKGLNRQLVRDCMINGMERWAAVDYFSTWFYQKLRLAPGKKVVPLGCNYESYDYPFLVEFFGGTLCYQEFFRSDVRDVQRLACGLNDLAEWKSERIPFPKVNLAYLCSSLGVKLENHHDALHDAMATAEVYRRMLNMGQFYKPMLTDEFDKSLENLATQYAAYRLSGPIDPPLSFTKFREIWENSFGRIE